jgi:hypothetical protein
MKDIIDKKVSQDFEKAQFKAFINKIISKLKKERNELISFEIVRNYLMPYNQTYKGVQSIPIEKIIGSEGRYKDFDKNFLPVQDHTRKRWENIDKAHYEDIQLPPIQVYKINDYYFVKDGNHRVSVAREKGMKFIDAEVIEIKTKIPLTENVDYEKLILEYEKQKFYEETKFKEIFPNIEINLTKPGRYDILLEQIKAHQYLLELLSNKKLDLKEAVKSWYQSIYLPIIKIIRRLKIMENFPDNTETDLYIWLLNHWNFLRKYDPNIDTLTAAKDFKEYVENYFVYKLKKTLSGEEAPENLDKIADNI